MSERPNAKVSRPVHQAPAAGSVALALLAFAMPALGSNILQSLSGSVTTLWVGRLLGPAALSATSNAHLVIGFITALLGGVSTAAGVMAGQALGAADRGRAKAIVRSSAWLFVLLSVPLAIIGSILSEVITSALAVPEPARPGAIIYLRWLFAALPVAVLLSLLIALLHGAGDARTPLVATTVLVIIDAGLTPLLIAGTGAWSGWGVGGAGVSYLIAHALALGFLVTVIKSRAPDLAPTRGEMLRRPDTAIIGWCMRAGSLVGLQFTLITGASLALMGLVNRYGTEASAAYGVAVTIWSYVQLPSQAVATAAAVVAAHAVGAQAWPRVREVTFTGIGLNLGLTALTVAGCYGLSEPLGSVFLPGEPDALALVVVINRVVLWAFLMFAVTMVLFGVLRAVNDFSVPFVVILVSHIGVRVPFAYLLAPTYGLAAVWWSYPAGLGAALVLTIIYFGRRAPWRRKRGANA